MYNYTLYVAIVLVDYNTRSQGARYLLSHIELVSKYIYKKNTGPLQGRVAGGHSKRKLFTFLGCSGGRYIDKRDVVSSKKASIVMLKFRCRGEATSISSLLGSELQAPEPESSIDRFYGENSNVHSLHERLDRWHEWLDSLHERVDSLHEHLDR